MPSEDRSFHLALGGFVLALLVVLGASIHLSSKGIDTGTLVFGQKALWRGHETLVRLAVIDAQSGRLLPQIDVRGVLGGRMVTARGEPYAELWVESETEGAAELSLEVRSDKDSEQIHIPFVSRAEPPALQARLAKVVPPVKKDGFELTVPAQPFVAGLDNRLMGRLLRDGKPAAVELADPARGTATTPNADGWFELVVRPELSGKKLPLQLAAGPRIELPITTEPRQLVLSAWETGTCPPEAVECPSLGFVKPGASIQVSVTTLPFRDVVRVDAWASGVVVASASLERANGPRRGQLTLPPDYSGPVGLCAFRDPAAPQKNSSCLTYYAGTADEAAAWLARLDKTIVFETPLRPELVALAMHRVTLVNPTLPLMRSTLEERLGEVGESVGGARRTLNIAFGVIVVIGLALAAISGMRYRRKVRRDLEAEMDGAVGPVAEGRLDHVVKVVQLAMALVSLLVALGMTLTLLMHLRWG